MNKKISSKIVALTFGILTISFLAAFYVIAWQEPKEAPPGGNVATPLNIGNVGQSKEGGLILNTGGAPVGLIVDKGDTKLGRSLILTSILGRPNPAERGQFYFDQNDNNLYYYNGTIWMRVQAVPSGSGKPCTSQSQCEAGTYCVDNYCCDSACSTTCYSCNVPGYEGICTGLTTMAEDGGCLSACTGCNNGTCTNFGNTAVDNVGYNTCTAPHYRCDGSGGCTAPFTILTCDLRPSGVSCHTYCIQSGYDFCYAGAAETGGEEGVPPPCTTAGFSDTFCKSDAYYVKRCMCANYVY